MSRILFLATGGCLTSGDVQTLTDAGVPADQIVSATDSGDGIEPLTEGDLFGAGEVVDLYGNNFDAGDVAVEFGPDAFTAEETAGIAVPAPHGPTVDPAAGRGDDSVIAGMGGVRISRRAAAAVLDSLEAQIAAGELPDLRGEVPESFSLAQARVLLTIALPPADVEATLAPHAQAESVPTTALTDALERRLQQLGTTSLADNLEAAAQAAWKEEIARWLDGNLTTDKVATLLATVRVDTVVRCYLYQVMGERVKAKTLTSDQVLVLLEPLRVVVSNDVDASGGGLEDQKLDDAISRLDQALGDRLGAEWGTLGREEEFDARLGEWDSDGIPGDGGDFDAAEFVREPSPEEVRQQALQAMDTLRGVTPQETIGVGRFAQLAVQAGFDPTAAVEYLQDKGSNGQIPGAAIQTFLATHQPRPFPDDDGSVA